MVLKRLIKVFVVVCGLLGEGLVGCARTEKAEGVGGPTLDQAWQDFRLAEYDLAERAFARIQATAPAGSEEYVRATFGLANVWNLRRPGEDIEKAQALYQQIIDDHPDHDLAPWCALALVRLQHVVPVGKDPDQRNYIVSNEKIERTGFKPDWDIQRGVAELIRGYQIVRRNQYANV